MKYLKNFKFIGDVSMEDADILAFYARNSDAILEFGMGGSTQILAQAKPEGAFLYSVDNFQKYRDRAMAFVNELGCADNVKAGLYSDLDLGTQQFDMVFNDGMGQDRPVFAQQAWNNLKTGGVLLTHDTRHAVDFAPVLEFIKNNHNSISCVDINAIASNGCSSNITVIHKKEHEPYVNWNYTEGKPMWAYGADLEDLPADRWNLI